MRPLLRRTDRLIGANVIGATLLVWAVLVAIDAFSGLVREIDEIGTGGYGLGNAVAYTLWTLPRRAYDMFGTAALIGCVLGLGALAPTAELVAMRAGGISRARIAAAALGAVALGLALVVAMGETVAPWTEQRAQALAAGAKSEDLIASGATGLWAREGASLLNARRGEVVGGEVALYDLRLYEFTADGQLERITVADEGRHAGGRWTFRGVVRTRFDPEQVRTETLPELVWDSTLDPRLLSVSILRPRYLGITDLAAAVAYLERNGLDAGAFESALWTRVFYPFNVLAVALAALPFAFGRLRSGGLAKRVLLGIVLALAWFLFQRVVVNLASVYALDHRLAHALPALALVAAAIVYFRRAG